MSLTRRGLFALLPAPLAGLSSGLWTVQPSPVPSSDPVAEAALAVGRELGSLEVCAPMFARMRVMPADRQLLSPRAIDEYEADQAAWQRGLLTTAETRLRAALASTSGLSVVIGGRVYTSPGRVRNPHVVEAVNVALLTPTKGGAR